ncbi:hypothetical protein [Gracilibacillus thailandensis]|jgi:hypothetical protein|uniref:Uncharacterized protein n=1 Tax=Gracilibacillus thailandensis TaxID=563735 RepID=A0A6N7QVS2_9BACI|nr:hypothetical protein [Gracilibacillus thailandensis]MRI65634.1 hypothetical protein [Gracilibacillus thailandensis]
MRLTYFVAGSILFLIVILLVSANSSSISNPNARNILSENPDADIIQWDGVVYQNVTDREWLRTGYQTGEVIGEIVKQTDRQWFYRDRFATKLEKGTILYANKSSDYQSSEFLSTILVEKDGQLLVYQALVEG